MPAEKDESIWKQLALFLMTLAALVVCGLLLQNFFSAIVGAIVLAVIGQRPYRWLSRHIRPPSLCATVALITVLLAVIIPCFFLAQRLAQQTVAAIDALRSEAMQQRFTGFVANHPAIASRLESFTSQIDINNAGAAVATWSGKHLALFVGGSVHVITQIVVMLFLLFFLFRDRILALGLLRSLLPLRENEADEMILRLRDTIYATALGRVAVAAVQGVLGSLAYWFFGIPGVAFWGLLTTLFALIPAFGAAMVWVPLALYLGLNGHWGEAALLVVWGGGVVSTIDNFLYPILVGNRLRSHTAIILLSILGGVALFGITGIVLGPVLFTVVGTLLEFWRERSRPAPQS